MTAGQVIDRLFGDDPARIGTTLALIVRRGGETVVERYAGGTDAATPLISWSVAKSVTHALLGLLVADGLLDPAGPAPVAEWQHDDRRRITVQHLLEMRSGLEFGEVYTDHTSDALQMLFGEGRHDMGAFAAAKPLRHEPGTWFEYSSGTTNILCRIARDRLGGGEPTMRAYLRDRLFVPAGMHGATPTFDGAGTFVGSSFLHAPARAFAAFGELYLRHGVGPAGDAVLPAAWTAHATAVRVATAADDPCDYGAHWWLAKEPELRSLGVFSARGFEGQYVYVVPGHEVVVVRLGKTDDALKPNVVALLHELVLDPPG